MNAAQIHLALNHAPLFLSLTGGLILAWGMVRKNDPVKTIALYMLAAAAIFTIPVYLTGEGTEELVEKFPGVNEAAIEKHEDMAFISVIIISITGIAALISLFVKKNAALKWVIMVPVILSLASFVSMAQTAHLGGLIRHAEINSGNVSASANGDQPGNKEQGKEDDDDKEKKDGD